MATSEDTETAVGAVDHVLADRTHGSTGELVTISEAIRTQIMAAVLMGADRPIDIIWCGRKIWNELKHEHLVESADQVLQKFWGRITITYRTYIKFGPYKLKSNGENFFGVKWHDYVPPTGGQGLGKNVGHTLPLQKTWTTSSPNKISRAYRRKIRKMRKQLEQ